METQEIISQLRTQPMYGLDLRARRHRMFALRLSKLQVFNQIVDRLNHGQSVSRVTDWFQQLEPKLQEDLLGCARLSVATYIQSLSFVMKQLRSRVAESHPRAQILPKGAPPPDRYQDVEAYLTGKIENRHSMATLQASFELQYQRVLTICKLEDELKVQLPQGNKAVQILTQIGAEIRKTEVAERMLDERARLRIPWEAEAKPSVITLSEVAEALEFDDADKNLLRDATTKVIDLIRDEASLGQYKNRLEPDEAGAAGPETTGHQ
jgi:hypothetical protein